MFTPSPYAVAVDAPALRRDVPQVDPHAEEHAARLGQALVAHAQHPLRLHRALHRIQRIGKLRQQVVAWGVYDAAAVVGDEAADEIAIGAERADRPRLVLGHQAAVAHRVGGEDGGESALRVRHN
jgi:hypothetical protein